MTYRFFHDIESNTVFRVPFEPDVLELRDTKGRLVGWKVSASIDVTRADNVLVNNRWKHRVLDPRQQTFEARYNRNEVVSFFQLRNLPKGTEIDEQAYLALQAEYQRRAEQNRGT